MTVAISCSRLSLVKAPHGAFYLLAAMLAKIRAPGKCKTGGAGLVDLEVGRRPIFYIANISANVFGLNFSGDGFRMG